MISRPASVVDMQDPFSVRDAKDREFQPQGIVKIPILPPRVPTPDPNDVTPHFHITNEDGFTPAKFSSNPESNRDS
jgi:hypothetical protein